MLWPHVATFWGQKVKGRPQGHRKGQKHVFGHIFGLIHARAKKYIFLDSLTRGLHS